ncbi:phosphoribosylanthranilate isomerase [Streptococcus ratti]|uniref:N-(5'-phosphoribosyl)anthranilate isomerase n=1 Tax=Streptococcus ratti FA-1 = DSM 20564 TaxID=699248 RepID=A0ABN0GX25_STRRT|nr:phosphoribosylanthranilate isomerase [Streptococcus ratti]EJN95094.1 N-(5'-phosphoribosyl)anthranilate isomerase [Streptococcus ratti FA-1 = DSM 20564]EMP70484.1 N-(5'-phosphoribosyl)anthranilate isomerase [Streptococcus ratti FA-1 = DSM 20564]QEY07091.1 phosphoribosylanthranilate isomerase [Streptococcus ratti]VEI59514.1 N-(5'-phosphoribosyl)anthranilate isomerase [Streptococcus mutans]
MTKVKICGLSTQEAVTAAVDSGADYIGFVFAPSKRQISLEKANKLAKDIPASVQTVGVFVSPSLEELEGAVKTVPLDLVQVHGDFDEELINQISVPIIRAVQVTKKEPILLSKARYLLFDAPMAGSGETFDWQLLRDKHIKQPFFIAGGLNADNVKECIQRFSPYAVDVSSGVETNGHKDSQKIIKFIESVKR